jgi:hypothetical protein
MKIIHLKNKPQILNDQECTYGIYGKGGNACLYVGETLDIGMRTLNHRKPSHPVLFKLSKGNRLKALELREHLEVRVLSYYAEDEEMFIKKLKPLLNVHRNPNKRISTYNSKHKNRLH